MSKRISVVALALSLVVAGVAWRGALQSAAPGKPDVTVLTANGSRPAPPIPNVLGR